MKHILLVFSLICSSFNFSQNINLSEDSEISILTIGPGNSLNDAFGHNAFRIKDPKKNIDITFDYGRYDFEAPNFYLNFAKGKLNYEIGSSYYYDFLTFYISENRTVKEQVLNLSIEEKNTLFNYLIENNKPENRNYLYDFFFDNCATKIKDVVNITLDNHVNFIIPENFEQKTFRALIHDHVDRNSWGCLGIDLALGSVIDRTATPEQHLFLPKNIYTFFKVATIKNLEPLVKNDKLVFKQTETKKSNAFFISPLFIFGLLSLGIIYATYKDYKRKKHSKWLDISLFSITGLIGILILLLWFATDHSGTKNNYNLLWAFAINIVVLGQFLKPIASAWFTRYIKLLIILLSLLTLHWIIGVQVFSVALIPFLIALLIRYIYLLKILPKE